MEDETMHAVHYLVVTGITARDLVPQAKFLNQTSVSGHLVCPFATEKLIPRKRGYLFGNGVTRRKDMK